MLSLIKRHKQEFWLSILIVFYLAINMYLTYNSFYLLNVVPAIILFLYLAFTRLNIVYYILIAFTPLSIPLFEFVDGSAIDFYIPTEPILFGILLIVIFKSIKERFIDNRILAHPVSIAILFSLFWLFITSITSSMPLVSFKFLLARIWFLCSFYLLAIILFRNTRNIGKMIWAYALPLLIVIGYAWSRHFLFGSGGLSDTNAAHFVMNPFYRDHTSYGAVLAMILFPFVGINLTGKFSLVKKLAIITIAIVLFLALIFSYSRAAWISVIISSLILTVILLRIKFKYLILLSAVLLIYVFSNQHALLKTMEGNRQDSSNDIGEHMQSVTNIASDASNLERLNRWASAMRMFKERPIFGWGPGTYMFKYAPFQHSSQRTTISTNFGIRGNAHSEYIGPLSESGVFGSLTFLVIVVASLLTAFRVYRKVKEKHLKQIVLSITLGYITYLFHGTLNNFLDTDKASSLFWGFIAVFVSLDLYYKPSKKVEGTSIVED